MEKLKPEDNLWMRVSRKGILPLTSHSVVNLMDVESPLTWVKKVSKSCSFGHRAMISST